MRLVKAAISRLAALRPYGELEADTDPATFLDSIHDELLALRAVADRAEKCIVGCVYCNEQREPLVAALVRWKETTK